MIHNDDADEIYARDINGDETADLFLKGHIYGCEKAKSSRLSNARYFAPYFGRGVSASHPGLQEGISYIAKIISVKTVESRSDFRKIVREVSDEHDFRGEDEYLDRIPKIYDFKKDQFRFIFLSVPRLAFNPPIQKRYLKKGGRFQLNQYYSFDDFYRAWRTEQIWHP